MKLNDFFNLVQGILAKMPAGIKLKKRDGTYVSHKAGTDFQVDLSDDVYSKDQVDDQINNKIAESQTGASISDSDTLTKLQELNTYLNDNKE